MNSSIVTTPNGGFEIAGAGATGTLSIGAGGAGVSTISNTWNTTVKTENELVNEIIDRYELNEMAVEHRVQEQEMIKLKEQNVDYADVIKQNMTKSMSQQILKKISFTKKHEKDLDVHSFRGRCWVFNREELIEMIKEIRAGYVG